MAEKKKDYLSPKTRAMKIQYAEMLCGSVSTERLEEDTFNWEEE